MTIKVNRFVKLINSFSTTGRYANKEISKMENACKNSVYQNRYFGKSLALLQNKHTDGFLKKDCFCFVQQDGSKIVKETINKRVFWFKMHSSNKTLMNESNAPINLVKKEVLYNLSTNKVEENAKKCYRYGGNSILIVKSAAERESSFPVTNLGKSLHPSIAEKSVGTNGESIYVEKYDKI